MSRAVFTYGTLLFPPVWHAVTGSFSFGEAARLEGFARYALVDRSYPGLVRETGASVAGILHDAVGAGSLARLDAFEGPEYERIQVMVEAAAGPRAAETYVLTSAAMRLLEAQAWAPEAFAPHLGPFLASRSP